MNKYYVTWGSREFIILAGNEVAACMGAMKKAFSKYVDMVGPMFRVSQRGFDQHDDDFTIELGDVIKLQILSNEYVYDPNA